MDTVKSRDGTLIAFDRYGEAGPAIIVVGGALSNRSFDPLSPAALLSPDFTVYGYDRRGRGDSTDTPPYAVEREVDDLEALIAHAGGEAYLYGLSSGAVLALHAARRLPGIRKVVAYEPPFIVDDSHPARPDDYPDQVRAAVAAGRPGDAVDTFMTFVGMPAEALPGMHEQPFWPVMESVAHTLVYDYAVMGDTQRGKPLARKRWESITTPVLVADGEQSPTFLHTGADAIAAILPNAQRRTLPGQDHAVAPDAIAPVLRDYFRN